MMRRSLAYDQGKEMARHKELTGRLGMPVYFCDPHSPWQRPSNKNLNGLVRQYLPKGIDLSIYTSAISTRSHTASTPDRAPSSASKHPRKSLWLSYRNSVMHFRFETAPAIRTANYVEVTCTWFKWAWDCFGPPGYPIKPLVSYQGLPTTPWVDPSSTGVSRRWGALNKTG